MNSPDSGFDRRRLLLLCAASFFSIVSMRMCDPMLPAFVDAFSINTGEAARTVSFFALAYGSMQLLFGPLGDRYGKFRVISCAVLACTVGNLFAALSQEWSMLLAARTLAGATAAGIIPLTLAWVGDSVSYERRQEVLGQVMFATVLGISLGQWSAGAVAETLGWRWTFVATTLTFLCLGAYMLRESRHSDDSQPSTQGFVHGMIHVLSIPWARWILALTALEGATAFAIMTFIPSQIYERFDLSLKHAAGVSALFAGGGLIYSFQARRMVAALGETGLALGGALMTAGFLIALTWLPNWYLAMPCCLLAGLGFTMLHATLQTHATQMAPSVRGTATALFGACIFLGQSLGIVTIAALLEDLGYQWVFVLCGALIALIGGAFAFSIRKHSPPDDVPTAI